MPAPGITSGHAHGLATAVSCSAQPWSDLHPVFVFLLLWDTACLRELLSSVCELEPFTSEVLGPGVHDLLLAHVLGLANITKGL